VNLYAFQSALQEFIRAKRILVWLFIAAGLYLISILFLRVNPSHGDVESYSMLSSLLTFRLLPLASAIFSSAVLSQEVEQKTIVYLLTRPVPRAQLFVMRTLASAIVVALVTAVAAIAVSAAVYGGRALGNEILYRDFVAIVVGALAYGTLFALLSLIVNRAMIVSLLFAFAWETSVPVFPGDAHVLSISSYLTAIAERPSGGAMAGTNPLNALAVGLGTNTLPADTGWMVMIGLIAFCFGLGAWWFTRFEYLPREDAE
jgi:ABC-2 type transport system permease protein